MSNLLLLTNSLTPSSEVLPALGLLLHHVRVAPAEASALIDTPPADAIMVDAAATCQPCARSAACCAPRASTARCC